MNDSWKTATQEPLVPVCLSSAFNHIYSLPVLNCGPSTWPEKCQIKHCGPQGLEWFAVPFVMSQRAVLLTDTVLEVMRGKQRMDFEMHN